jgi:hypothetical protein
MVRTAKKLVATIGVLSTPNVKQGRVLLPATSEMVKEFYVFHEIATSCHGQKLIVLLTYIVLRDKCWSLKCNGNWASVLYVGLVCLPVNNLNVYTKREKLGPSWDRVGIEIHLDHLCGLVVRVSGYRYRGPGFNPRRY